MLCRMVGYFRNNEVMERIFKRQSRCVWVGESANNIQTSRCVLFLRDMRLPSIFFSDACFTHSWFHKKPLSYELSLQHTCQTQKHRQHKNHLPFNHIPKRIHCSFFSNLLFLIVFFMIPPCPPRSGGILQFPAALITSTQEEWSETRKALKEMKQRQITPDLRWTLGAIDRMTVSLPFCFFVSWGILRWKGVKYVI